MISKSETQEIVKKFGNGENDTGSAQVQIAILTKRINNLTPHFAKFKKDKHSMRGLLKLIGQRRSFLKYYSRTNQDGYLKLIKELGLRK